MARIQKDIADYFPHDAHACSGDTITVLQSHYGNDGYAVWFKLLEKLTHSEGHYIDCRHKIKWQILIAYLGISEITTVEMLNLLVEMQAIDSELWDSRVIWCQKLVDNLTEVYKNRKREIPRKPIIMPDNGITTNSNGITTNSYTQSRVEESRVDNSRVDSTKEINKEKKPIKKRNPKVNEISNEDWMASLIANPIYSGLDIKLLYGKMLVWYENMGKKPTRRRFLNWLNREEKPLKLKGDDFKVELDNDRSRPYTGR